MNSLEFWNPVWLNNCIVPGKVEFTYDLSTETVEEIYVSLEITRDGKKDPFYDPTVEVWDLLEESLQNEIREACYGEMRKDIREKKAENRKRKEV